MGAGASSVPASPAARVTSDGHGAGSRREASATQQARWNSGTVTPQTLRLIIDSGTFLVQKHGILFLSPEP